MEAFLLIRSTGLLAERVTPVSSGSGIAYVVVTRPGGGSGGPGDPPPPPFEPEGMSGASLEEVVEAGAGLAEGLVLDDYSNEPCCPVTTVYYAYADHLGSVVALTDGRGTVVQRQAFDAWGRRRNVQSWVTDDSQVPAAPYRWLWGYTGHEHLDEFGLINMNARLYDPKLGRMLSVDNYVSDATSALAYNRYSYANCNPISYIDPDGNFVTWSIGSGGFSIGLNFTPMGIPLGFGINIGWSNGFSAGGYGEVGYRVGGTGFGSGITISQSFNYNFQSANWSTSTTESVYASYLFFNAGFSMSQTYDFKSRQWGNDWGVSAGIGFGNDEKGFGLAVTYGSSG